MKTLPVLSLWEPWGTLCVRGLKQFETRGWAMELRGPLVIHAAKKLFDPMKYSRNFTYQLERDGVKYRAMESYGQAIGMVEVIDCRPVAAWRELLSNAEKLYGDWRDIGDDGKPRYGIRLANPVEFVRGYHLKGRQGIFSWTLEETLLDELLGR